MKYEGKKLLILGANPETVSLVKRAQEMGIYTIVTDYDQYAYAKQFADKAYNVDAMDLEALIELAKKEKIDGIAVGVAEALLPTYCRLCKILSMPCYTTLEQVQIMIKKDAFKEACRRYSVPTIEEYKLEDEGKIEYPVIVKPVDSCSSKGITVCYNKEELLAAINIALSFSHSQKYLIERYIRGDEVIAYYVIQDGIPIFVGMCDRYTYKATKGGVQLPTSYIFPSRYIDEYLTHTDLVVKNMLRELGIKSGSIFFQALCDENGVTCIYESGYRLNGAQEHLIISRLSGIDAKDIYINLALTGKEAEIDLLGIANPKSPQFGCKLSPLVKTGIIKKISGLEEIANIPDVVSVNPSYREGDMVMGEGTLKQIVCRFFIISNNKKELRDTIEKIYRILKVEDENGENMLVGEFDTNIIDQYY